MGILAVKSFIIACFQRQCLLTAEILSSVKATENSYERRGGKSALFQVLHALSIYIDIDRELLLKSRPKLSDNSLALGV
jgi:hypothetical protein